MLLELTQKRLAILKEAVPRATRIAVIMNPDDPIIPMQWREAEAAAGPLGVRLQRLDVRPSACIRRSSEGQGRRRPATCRPARRAAERGDRGAGHEASVANDA